MCIHVYVALAHTCVCVCGMRSLFPLSLGIAFCSSRITIPISRYHVISDFILFRSQIASKSSFSLSSRERDIAATMSDKKKKIKEMEENEKDALTRIMTGNSSQ